MTAARKDIVGERRRNNLTAAVGPLLGAGRTASTLPPAGGGGAFFAVPPAATVRQQAADAACVQQRAAERRRSDNVQRQRTAVDSYILLAKVCYFHTGIVHKVILGSSQKIFYILPKRIVHILFNKKLI